MKKILITVFLVLSGWYVSAQEIKKIKISELSNYIKKSDRPLLVNFWATWCSPCIEEIPYFQSTVQKYAGKNVELVLVNLDTKKEYPARLTSFIKSKNYKATFFWLDETNADLFCPVIDEKWDGSIPASLLINNKTRYRKFFDRQLTRAQTEVEIRKMIID